MNNSEIKESLEKKEKQNKSGFKRGLNNIEPKYIILLCCCCIFFIMWWNSANIENPIKPFWYLICIIVMFIILSMMDDVNSIQITLEEARYLAKKHLRYLQTDNEIPKGDIKLSYHAKQYVDGFPAKWIIDYYINRPNDLPHYGYVQIAVNEPTVLRCTKSQFRYDGVGNYDIRYVEKEKKKFFKREI